jgi:hypothetical protein
LSSVSISSSSSIVTSVASASGASYCYMLYFLLMWSNQDPPLLRQRWQQSLATSSWHSAGWLATTGWSTLASVAARIGSGSMVCCSTGVLGNGGVRHSNPMASSALGGEDDGNRGVADLRICGTRHDDDGRVHEVHQHLPNHRGVVPPAVAMHRLF